MLLARDPLVDKGFPHARAGDVKPGHPVDSIDSQTESVSVIANGQLERRVNVTLLLVAADVNVALAGSAVGETVDQPRVTVKVKDHRLVRCENGLELEVRHTVRVLSMRYQPE